MKSSLYEQVSQLNDDYIFTANSPINGTKKITVGDLKKVFGGSASGGGDVPVGTIIAYLSAQPPEHYLACDGSYVSRNAYPELAKFFEDSFGSAYYFGDVDADAGGDGFALPYFDGLFLKGYDGKTPIGDTQQATEIPYISMKNGVLSYPLTTSSQPIEVNYPDRTVTAFTKIKATNNHDSQVSESENVSGWYTAVPDNTTVLWCIKAESSDLTNVYGYEEKKIGTWVDGKTIYRKCIDCKAPPVTTDGSYRAYGYPTNVDNIHEIVRLYAKIESNDFTANLSVVGGVPTLYCQAYYNKEKNQIMIENTRKIWSNNNVLVIMEYTKTE